MVDTAQPAGLRLPQRNTAPGTLSAEELARFTEREHEVLCRRWRLFAPITFVLIGLTEVAPFFSPNFPSAMHVTGWVLALLAGMYLLARRKPGRRVMGWATAVTGIVVAAYSATPAAELGRYQSQHVLAMAVLIAMLPGIFSLTLAEAAGTLGGSLVAWVVVCGLWKSEGPVDSTGLDVVLTYLVFLCVVTLVAHHINRRLRLREFAGRCELERVHRFAVEEVLHRHLPPSYVDRVLSGEHPLDGPPERRVVTVVFADIVSFTPLSDGLPPEELARLVGRFYDVMAGVAFEHGATLDKFIGDAVMALVGAPDTMLPEEQARRAVAMARDWHRAARELVWPGSRGQGLRLRVGIHQDPVAVGAFGGRLRSEYTVLGRGVNIAARLEQRCQQGDILVSEPVFQQLAPRPGSARELGALELKGIPEPVRCYCLPGLEDEQVREVPAA
jgi:class 3 adenylate cyclase